MFMALALVALQQSGAAAVQMESGTVRTVVEQIAARPGTFSMEGRELRPLSIVPNGMEPDEILRHIALATNTTVQIDEASVSFVHTPADSAALVQDWSQNAIASLRAQMEQHRSEGELLDHIDRFKLLLDRYNRAPTMRERFDMMPEIRRHSLDQVLLYRILERNIAEIERELSSLDLRQAARPKYAFRIEYSPGGNTRWESELLADYNAARLAFRSIGSNFSAIFEEFEYQELGLPTTSEQVHDIWLIVKPDIATITINMYAFGEQGGSLAIGSARVPFNTHPFEHPEWLEDLEPVEAPLAAQLALADPDVLDPVASLFTAGEPAPNQEWLVEFLDSGTDILTALDPLTSEIARVTGKTVVAAYPDHAYILAINTLDEGKIDPQQAISAMLAQGTIKITESEDAVIIGSQHPIFHRLIDTPRNVQDALRRLGRQAGRLGVFELARAATQNRTADYLNIPHFNHYRRLLNASGIEGPDQNAMSTDALMLLGHLQIPPNWREATPLIWAPTQWNASARRYVLNWLNTSMFVYPFEAGSDSPMLRERFTPYLLRNGIPSDFAVGLHLDVRSYWKTLGSPSSFAGMPLDSLAFTIDRGLFNNPGQSIPEVLSIFEFDGISFNDFPTIELRLIFPGEIGARRTAILIEGAPMNPFLEYADWPQDKKDKVNELIDEQRRNREDRSLN